MPESAVTDRLRKEDGLISPLRFPVAAGRLKRLDEKASELTDADLEVYLAIISTELNSEQRARISQPPQVYARQETVLALHWHPEFIPMELVLVRINATFPNREEELIIPTQHNTLLTLNGFAGVEIDCHSREFNRKIQLLAHFSEAKVQKADVLKAMLQHTFRYRSSQLFEFLDSIIEPAFEDRLQLAASYTGADADLVEFVRVNAGKLRSLIQMHEALTPPEAIKNKLVQHYFDSLRETYDDTLVNHAQSFLKAVKEIVKARFALEYFYDTHQFLEEIRGLGGGVVIPHPEQFWPVLLADYDVDGIEVWNPQSRDFTGFLINAVNRQNRARPKGKRPLLILMGDDTHMGEKARDPRLQDPEKAGREIGVQPAWEDLKIKKSLIVANADRGSVIREYMHRLG